MTETLIKIKAGTLSSQDFCGFTFESHHSHFDYDDEENYNNEYDDYYGEEDSNYGIGKNKLQPSSNLNKQYKSKKKQSNKQVSNVITAKIKKNA